MNAALVRAYRDGRRWMTLQDLARDAGYDRQSKGNWISELVERNIVEEQHVARYKEYRLKEGWEALIHRASW